jgi:predicted transposase YbfD/YdcC
MPSLPVPAARSQYLLDLLGQVPDPRKKRGRRHPLVGLLTVGIAAVIGGSKSFAAIGQSAAEHAGPEVLKVLGAARGAADESTFRRAFALVSADVLDRVLGAWLLTRAVRAGGRLVIAVDGKTVRGAKGKDGKAPHLVAALAHGIGAVLGQVAVEEKSNEIPAVRELLKAFADLAGVALTTDAMHTQHDTAQLILGRGADYVMTVKANMPTLYKQLKKLPRTRIPSVSFVSAGHGRRARRTVRVALAPAWTGFEGAAQVAQMRRTVVKKGKETVEVVYLITSDRSASPETLAAWVRRHWHIENKLHWVRDVTYQEDKSLVRTGNAPRVMASLPGHQHPATGRPHEHRRRQPPPCPRPAADAQATSGCMNTTLPGPCSREHHPQRHRPRHRRRVRRGHPTPGRRLANPPPDARRPALRIKLATNSFLAKGGALTVGRAPYGFAVDNLNPWIALLGILPAVVFWWLDSFFLRTESLYRCLYEDARGSTPKSSYSR